jgi:hypothetical protein
MCTGQEQKKKSCPPQWNRIELHEGPGVFILKDGSFQPVPAEEKERNGEP